MTHFVQIHLLTSYPPANLNRDDLGRPKTAIMGGVPRLRVSSQSLKRAWRTSDSFQTALAGHIGTRTKEIGPRVERRLIEAGFKEKDAREAASTIAEVFGKLKKDSAEIEQLAHFSPEEFAAVDALADRLAAERRGPTDEELKLLRKTHRAADIAMFGRMLAASPEFNADAAVQVAHAITVHRAAVEDDFFTAVDDLNTRQDDMGAGHVGEAEFGAGLFYLYLCVNRSLLEDNLQGDEDLAARTIRALLEAAAKVAPSGRQNSFASRAWASYIQVERGEQQPRSLSVAFLKPVRGDDVLTSAVDALDGTLRNMDAVYGPAADTRMHVNASKGEGSFEALLDFAGAAPAAGDA